MLEEILQVAIDINHDPQQRESGEADNEGQEQPREEGNGNKSSSRNDPLLCRRECAISRGRETVENANRCCYARHFMFLKRILLLAAGVLLCIAAFVVYSEYSHAQMESRFAAERAKFHLTKLQLTAANVATPPPAVVPTRPSSPARTRTRSSARSRLRPRPRPTRHQLQHPRQRPTPVRRRRPWSIRLCSLFPRRPRIPTRLRPRRPHPRR